MGVMALHYLLYRDRASEWRWTLYAANNKKIATSGEGYHNKEDAKHAITLVMQTNNATPIREEEPAR